MAEEKSYSLFKHGKKLYVLFYKGFLSQWYPCTFIEDDVEFKSAEMYMMYKKAMLFDDMGTAMRILSSKSPKDIKKLGREVKDFDEKTWDNYKREIVFNGNLLKFSQNESLLKKLLEFPDCTFVEASPFDRIWGIGFNIQSAQSVNIDSWGKNLLGKILTKVKYQLKK